MIWMAHKGKASIHSAARRAGNRLANGEIMPGRDLWRGNLKNRIHSRELMAADSTFNMRSRHKMTSDLD